MKFIIMTGMSGSGKTVALKALEDYGYYCVDNIPVQLITGFADLLADSNKPNPGAVLGIDIRNAGELASIRPFELSALLITQSEVLRGCSPLLTHSTLA